MCAGALKWARLGELIYGARDSKEGYTNYYIKLLSKKTKVKKGVLSKDCSSVLTNF